MRWRKIDPHFTDPKTTRPPTEAPGPSARFPASEEGWADALAYAHSKRTPVMRGGGGDARSAGNMTDDEMREAMLHK